MGTIKKMIGNLAVDFGLLLILAALVAIVSLIGLKQVNGEYQSLISHSVEIGRLASKIRIDFQEAILLEETFLLTLNREGFETAYETHVERHQQYTQSLDADIGELDRLVSQTQVAEDEIITADLAQIRADVERYKHAFDRIVTLLEQRGGQEAGLEADFRQKAAQVDAHLKQHPEQTNLQVAYLQLRLAEELYLSHRSPEYVDNVYAAYLELIGELEKAPLSRQESVQIDRLLTAYDDSFQQVGQIDAEIFTLQTEINELVIDVQALAGHIDETAQAEATMQIARAGQITAQTTQLVTMSVVVIVVFGLGLGFAMYYQLNQDKFTRQSTAVLSQGGEIT